MKLLHVESCLQLHYSGLDRRNPIIEAFQYKQMLETFPALTHARIAEQFNVCRIRICRCLGLLKLHGKIIKFVKNIKDPILLHYFSERRLRSLRKYNEPKEQLARFNEMHLEAEARKEERAYSDGVCKRRMTPPQVKSCVCSQEEDFGMTS